MLAAGELDPDGRQCGPCTKCGRAPLPYKTSTVCEPCADWRSLLDAIIEGDMSLLRRPLSLSVRLRALAAPVTFSSHDFWREMAVRGVNVFDYGWRYTRVGYMERIGQGESAEDPDHVDG